MSDRTKKIFLALSIIVPFMVYCVYYYSGVIKNAPYKFVEFESLSFYYGTGDSLQNRYESKTGSYQYINKRDSLVKKTVMLKKDDLLYLHRKAAELGMWNFPTDMTGSNPDSAARYHVEFRYQRKTKKFDFSSDFNGNPKLKDAAVRVIGIIDERLAAAEARKAKSK